MVIVVADAVPTLKMPMKYVALRPANMVAPVTDPPPPRDKSGNGSKIEKLTADVVPPGVVIVKGCVPRGAVGLMLNAAKTAPPKAFTFEIVTPVNGEIVEFPVAKLLPSNSTLTVVPRMPNVGLMDASAGTPGVTANGSVPLVPLGVPTVTL